MTIYLEPNEEITSVVDYLIRAKATEIILVVPIGAQILQSLINLKLLKREADNLGKKVGIITQDKNGQRLAKKAGFEIYDAKDNLTVKAVSRPEEIVSADLSFADGWSVPIGGGDLLKTDKDIEIAENKEKPAEAQAYLASVSPRKKLIFRQQKTPLTMTDIVRPPSIDGARKKILPETEENPPEIIHSFRQTEKPDQKQEELNPRKIRRGERFLNEIILKQKNICGTCGQILKNCFTACLASLSFKKFLGIFVVIGFLIGGAMLWFNLPRVDIFLQLRREEVSESISLSANKNILQIDGDLKKIPARLIKLEKGDAREFSATGEKQVNERARGMIRIFNEYSSNPQTLVEKTRFLSENGKLFRLTKTIVVPGAKIEEGKIVANSIGVEIVADESGEDYNVGPGKFTIPGFTGTPKYTAFYGRSSEPMTGGAIGIAKIISQEDLNRAKENLSKELREQAFQELKQAMAGDLIVPDSATREILNYLGPAIVAGQRAEKFVLSPKIVLESLAINEKDVKTLLAKSLGDKISEQKELLNSSLTVQYNQVNTDWASGTLNLQIVGKGLTREKINIGQLKTQLRGRDENTIGDILSQMPQIETMKINFWPFWVKRIPQKLEKIRITLD